MPIDWRVPGRFDKKRGLSRPAARALHAPGMVTELVSEPFRRSNNFRAGHAGHFHINGVREFRNSEFFLRDNVRRLEENARPGNAVEF